MHKISKNHVFLTLFLENFSLIPTKNEEKLNVPKVTPKTKKIDSPTTHEISRFNVKEK